MKLFKTEKKEFFIIMEGVALTVILSLCNNYFLMFAKRMGAQNIHIALLNSIPPLVAILVLIPCGIIIEKMKDKKLVTCALIGINSIFYLIIALIPFIPQQIKLTVYIIVIGVMNWPGSLYVTSWQSFFSDNFSGDTANKIYSLRSKYSTLVGLITVLIAGYILSALPKSDGDRIIIYQCFFIACFFISMVQILFLSKVKHSDEKIATHIENKGSSFRVRDIKEIFNNKKFMIFCGCSVVFHFAWQACWPIFFIYNVDYVKVNEFQLGIIGVASGLTAFLFYSLWSKVARKLGNSLVLAFGAFGLAITPFLYLRVWDFYVVVIFNITIGVAIAGFTLTLFCSLLEILPDDKKTVYIAFFNTLLSITGFAAPLLSIWVLGHIGIFGTFLIFGLLRMVGTAMYALRWYVEKDVEKEKVCIAK